MWEKVSSRKHKPQRIFPYGSNADEVMLYGTVDYGLKDGKTASVEWAGHAHLVKEGDAVKMDVYQVYLVSPSLDVCTWSEENKGSFALQTRCRIKKAVQCPLSLRAPRSHVSTFNGHLYLMPYDID